VTLVSSSPDTDAEAPKRESRLIPIAGLVIACLAALFSGILEIFLTPLRAGGFPIGVAIPAAVVANIAIAWFAVTTTGRKRAIGAPWLLWTVLMFFAAGAKRSEGDYLINGNDWIALIMILLGSLAFAVYLYRMILRRPPLSADSQRARIPHQ
jgi:hypothetical protein